MERQFYLDLARSGLRMPIGTDLVVHEAPDPSALLRDGERLGKAVETAARRYRTPLAVPQMDLELEKADLLHLLDVPAAEAPKYHFRGCPGEEALARVAARAQAAALPRLRAQADAIAYIARETDRVPVGMCIGPFSLMTKLLADPITPICMAGAGVTAEEEPEILAVEQCLELAYRVIVRSVCVQAHAGARALFLAEPAANQVYLSPKQMDAGSDIFDRYVMRYNRRIKALLDELGVDLLFHCCGELTDTMVSQFASLDPAILSLGSSRKLWQDAALVPKRTVLFGNLPSKQFYSDALVTREEIARQARELIARMRQVDHPFILGSECDVLSVPGCEETIQGKIEAFLSA